MPSWIPGSYLMREFARHVVGIEAHSEAKPVHVEKIDKNTWRCDGLGKDLTVTATVYALDQSVRGNYLDGRRAYFNGPCVFLRPRNREQQPVQLIIEPPNDPRCTSWQVATAMQAVKVDARGFGVYQAADYAELIDHPVEISDFASVEFEAAGVPHRLVVAGRFDADLERVATDLAQLCEYQIDFFGQPAPFDHYLFLGLAVGDGYGGLEHRASSSLIFSRDDLPKHGQSGVPKEYLRFLALASHEYFHTWHIKRSKPAAFMPYRLDERNYTSLLWVFEGITSYYQDRMLLQSELIGSKAYLQQVGEQLTRVYRAPGRFRQSIATSSFDAWDVLYKPEANSPNAGVSYYSKGALVALALDLTVRRNADITLDDIVREFWNRYGAQDQGVGEDGFEKLAMELGGDELEDFFELAVRGTEDLPLAELLAGVGVTLRMRASAGPADKGGKPGTGEAAPRVLGARFRALATGLELVTVFDGGPAQRAGLNPRDVVIAIDGLKVNEGNIKPRLARFEELDRVSISVFRGDELLELAIEMNAAPLDICYLELDPQADSVALLARQAWLGE